MSTFQKSLLLWVSGSVLGGAIGLLTKQSAGKTLGAAVLGSMLVGAVGDKYLERACNRAENKAIDARTRLRRSEGYDR